MAFDMYGQFAVGRTRSYNRVLNSVEPLVVYTYENNIYKSRS